MRRDRSEVASETVTAARRRYDASPGDPRPVAEVGACLDGVGADLRDGASDGALAADFADFLDAGRSGSVRSAPPDPEFRERLRRRLWRVHVLAGRHDRPSTH